MDGKRRTLGFLTLVFLALAGGGCIAPGSAPVATPEAVRIAEYEGDTIESLFRGDSEVLSDAEIARILAHELEPGGHRRVATVGFGTRRWWSEDDARTETEALEALLETLEAAGSVDEALSLPTLLIPEKRTVPNLREAAARFQADLLVVYKARVRTFEKYRVFGKDEVKALCTVEMVVLDVRTGIVPFTAQATETIVARKTNADLNFNETIVKAVAAGSGKALLSAGDEVATFLDRAP